MPQANSDGPLDRAFAIVGHVAGQVRAVSVAEIANALALPLPTAHRLIGNLEQRGLLQKAVGTKRYVVGNQLVTLSAKVIGAAFRTARRHAVLRAVAAEIGEQCEIGVVRDNVVAYVDSVRVSQPQGLQFNPGEAAPLHCTSTGKIYMSRLPERAREKLCHALALTKYTETTIVDIESLMKVLDETRKRGWAKTNEEYVRGVVGCAVPILSPDRELIACLGVSVPVARVSFAELDRFIGPLQKAAALLSETILQADEEDASDASETLELLKIELSTAHGHTASRNSSLSEPTAPISILNRLGDFTYIVRVGTKQTPRETSVQALRSTQYVELAHGHRTTLLIPQYRRHPLARRC